MQTVDLRDLVKNPITLTGQVAALKDHHQIDEALPKGLKYSGSGTAPILLPGGGAGMYRLRATIQGAIPGIDEGAWREAHIGLLRTNQTSHRRFDASIALPDDCQLNDTHLGRARSVLLAAVFRDETESFDGEEFSKPRFGGVGVLTVIPTADNPKLYEEAWLNLEWTHNTSQMLRVLERMAGPNLQPPAVHRRIDVLVAEDLWRSDELLVERVRRLGCLTGIKAEVHQLRSDSLGAVRKRLAKQQPSQLISLGVNIDESVTAAFRERRSSADYHQCDVASSAEATEWLRDSFPRLMGVGANLMRQQEREPVLGRPPMPVALPVDCIHLGTTAYVHDGSTGLWWTRDFAQHGGAIFKTYLRVNNQFRWHSDRDGEGRMIHKHKGPQGKTIMLSDNFSCGDPSSDLR